ncbi:MAG: molybdopterin-guanine dinucleotide biosynthesis protein B, partial [Desulfobacterales bacterium]
MKPPIISIVGKSNSGKTVLVEKLIKEIKKRGYRIGIIKHAHHRFTLDKRGKDSWRHKVAGADTVVVLSPDKLAMVKDHNDESIDSLRKYFMDVDLVITEGFKRERKPKIEILRGARNDKPLCGNDDSLIALVTDTDTVLDVPTFGMEDIE